MPGKGNGKGKGGKNRRRGKKNDDEKRQLQVKEEGQEYARCVKLLGNFRLEAECMDGKTRLAIIRGSMRRRNWINQGDIILLGLRDFQDDKADVILKYSSDEARRLQKDGHIPDTVSISALASHGPQGAAADAEDDDIPFEFEAL
jgi:translation initiation factor 1A